MAMTSSGPCRRPDGPVLDRPIQNAQHEMIEGLSSLSRISGSDDPMQRGRLIRHARGCIARVQMILEHAEKAIANGEGDQ